MASTSASQANARDDDVTCYTSSSTLDEDRVIANEEHINAPDEFVNKPDDVDDTISAKRKGKKAVRGKS
jgi:hypothetical protein